MPELAGWLETCADIGGRLLSLVWEGGWSMSPVVQQGLALLLVLVLPNVLTSQHMFLDFAIGHT